MIRAFLSSPAGFKLAAFLCGLSMMFWVESILPSRPWQAARRVRLLFHLTLSVFNNILLRLTVIGPLLVWQGVVNSKGWGLCPLLSLKGPWEILASLVVSDLLGQNLRHLPPAGLRGDEKPGSAARQRQLPVVRIDIEGAFYLGVLTNCRNLCIYEAGQRRSRVFTRGLKHGQEGTCSDRRRN